MVRQLQAEGRRSPPVGTASTTPPPWPGPTWALAIGAGTDASHQSADIVLMKSDSDGRRCRRGAQPGRHPEHQGEPVLGLLLNSIGIPPLGCILSPAGLAAQPPMFAAAATAWSSGVRGVQCLIPCGFSRADSAPGPSLLRTSPAPPVMIAERLPPVPMRPELSRHFGRKQNQELKEELEATTKTLNIEGMMRHCVAHVEKALSALGGATSAKADLEGKRATVTLAAPVSRPGAEGRGHRAGYEVVQPVKADHHPGVPGF